MQLRVCSYNSHGCVGRDRKCSPERIADVIAACGADVVALQEVDVGRARSSYVNQPEFIADRLGMTSCFYATVRRGGEEYGGALLSRLPMRLIKSGALPGEQHLEPRGALWAQVDLEMASLNMMTTHLGLRPYERKRQVDALLGPEWLSNPEFLSPGILCGDFNLTPISPLYRRLSGRMRDARQILRQPFRHGTFYGVLALDHIFLSEGIGVEKLSVQRSALARVASDHMPIVAHVALK